MTIKPQTCVFSNTITCTPVYLINYQLWGHLTWYTFIQKLDDKQLKTLKQGCHEQSIRDWELEEITVGLLSGIYTLDVMESFQRVDCLEIHHEPDGETAGNLSLNNILMVYNAWHLHIIVHKPRLDSYQTQARWLAAIQSSLLYILLLVF